MAQRNQTYWTVGYAPFNRILSAGVFNTRAEAEQLARKLNSEPGEFKGRGCKAVRCDFSGRLVR